ncbi:MAG: alanine--tRNA ligase [Actinobacteria bacterium]|nr:alanine--tRNA ligase [Actinomycetota bacterium]
MKGSEIRDLFIGFFAERDHRVVPSSSLVPEDPTLLLTTAGMVQFKPYFLGAEEPPYSRATSVQKCARTTDIESVGLTARHMTFFEMLGDFSFGDYYKKEIIPWAWELVTGVLSIDPGSLWISIFEEDDEAGDIWKSVPGVIPERVIKLGADDNFWAMGPTGPCGPCSEILYDRGKEFACGPDCAAGCDCDRFLEIWNLVFMQYDRAQDGSRIPLPKKNIDTGMGLERVAAIKQGVATVFETDLMMPLLEAIKSICGVGLGDSGGTDVSLKIISDHVRAATFLISDGLIPSNEAGGYILRRLLRRAVRHGKLLGIEEPFLYRIADVVVELFGAVYHGLKDHHPLIRGVIKGEEERFGQTLQQGIDLLEKVLVEHGISGKNIVDGDTVFYLHDTLGFPLELTREIALDRGVEIDIDGFDCLMEEQRVRARLSREEETQCVPGDLYREISTAKGKTDFHGYGCDSMTSRVIALVSGRGSVQEVKDREEVEVVLESTPFYAEAGGQVGDTGTLEGPDGSVEVVDTCSTGSGLILHKGVVSGSITLGDEIKAVVDAERRADISRNHSATHILHWALRKVLGEHARQSGSLVTPERLRFDFTHFQPVSHGELAEIERLANVKVLEDEPVSFSNATREEAMAGGAMALFGEKYGDEVRIVEMGNFSSELCGGIHVDRTGRVGPIRIMSESGIGAGLRRIEATTGMTTIGYYRHLQEILGEVSRILRAENDELPGRVSEMVAQQKAIQKEQARKKSCDIATAAGDIIRTGLHGVSVRDEKEKVFVARVDGEKQKTLRDLIDIIASRGGFGVTALAGDAGGSAQIVVKIKKELVAKGPNAKELAGEAGRLIGGGGGGREDMAAAGGGLISGIDEALKYIADTEIVPESGS